MKILTSTLFFGALIIGAGSAFADTVPNFSFENSPPGYGNPPGWTLFNDSASPTFSDNTQVIVNNLLTYPFVSGVTGSQFVTVHVDHNSLGRDNPTPIIPVNGSLAGLVSGSLGTFAPDTTYSFTASLGLGTAFDLLNVGLALGTGAPTLTDVFPSPNSSFASVLVNGGNLSDRTLEDKTITLDTKAFPKLVGQSINGSLILQSDFTYGRDALFDDVRLSSAPDSNVLPEPSFFGLIGIIGVAGLMGRRLRQATAKIKKPSAWLE